MLGRGGVGNFNFTSTWKCLSSTLGAKHQTSIFFLNGQLRTLSKVRVAKMPIWEVLAQSKDFDKLPNSIQPHPTLPNSAMSWPEHAETQQPIEPQSHPSSSVLHI
jgi:hypothetical protein